jgi:hypothetical protein
LGSEWGGTDVWVRGQGEAFAKGVWYHSRWENASMISIDWAGITVDEKEENRVWCEDFIEKSNRPRQKSDEPPVDWDDPKVEEHLQNALDKQRRECRGGCGVKDATKVCSRCKEICKSSPSFFFVLQRVAYGFVTLDYCSSECQKDDWKVCYYRPPRLGYQYSCSPLSGTSLFAEKNIIS